MPGPWRGRRAGPGRWHSGAAGGHVSRRPRAWRGVGAPHAAPRGETLRVRVRGRFSSERRERCRWRNRHDRRAGSDRKSTRLNSSHSQISYAVFCLKKKKNILLNVKMHDHYSVDPDLLRSYEELASYTLTTQ